jgi:hypothetical protein
VDIRTARHKRRGKDKESKRQDRLSEILHVLPVDILTMTSSELGGYVTGILAYPEMIPATVKKRLKK